jgi:hypothetical protein
MKSTSIFQRLSDSEIEFAVACSQGGGFDVGLGSAAKGFLANDHLSTWDDVREWLHLGALKFYPNSDYAKQALGRAWHAVDGPQPPPEQAATTA